MDDYLRKVLVCLFVFRHLTFEKLWLLFLMKKGVVAENMFMLPSVRYRGDFVLIFLPKAGYQSENFKQYPN